MRIMISVTFAAALAGVMLLVIAGDMIVADFRMRPSYEQVVAADYVAFAPVRHTITETTQLTFIVGGDTWAWISLDFWVPAWPTGILVHSVPADQLGRLAAGYSHTYSAGKFVEEGFVGDMRARSTAPLSLTWSIINRPPTPTPNVTETPCPIGTQAPFWVEPVTSPTDRFTQTVTVVVGDADLVTVTAESGSFDSQLFEQSQAFVEVKLLPGVLHHLTVEARVPQRIMFGGCKYGGFIRTTTFDKNGRPLWISQKGWRSYLPFISR